MFTSHEASNSGSVTPNTFVSGLSVYSKLTKQQEKL